MRALVKFCRLGTGGENSELDLLLGFTGDNKPLLQKRKAKEIINSHTSSPAKSTGEMVPTASAICCLYGLMQSQLEATKTNFQGA